MAFEPINYLAMVPQQDFLRDIQGGLQLGDAYRQAQQQQQAQQIAQQQEAQYQADVAAFNARPSAQAAAALALKWPKQREAAKQAWDQQDAALRKSQGEAALQVGFALESGNTAAAKDLLQNRIAALDNSGMESTHEKQILGAIDTHPDAVRGELLKWAAFTQDPEKFAENYGRIGDELRKQKTAPDMERKAAADANAAEADATTKGVIAKYADQNALGEIEKRGWDIKALQSDIDYKKQQARIETMKVALSRADNDLKRQELGLKIKEAQTNLDNKVRERADEAQTQIDAAKSVTGLIDEIFSDPDSLAAVTGTSAWKGSIPGTKNRAVAGKIEQLSNMLGALNLDKLKGPTSDKDIMFVKSIAANLDRYQDEGEFRKVLGKVRDITARREEQLRKKFGVPATKEDPAIQPRNVVVDY
jgi:hypothetical protein